MCSNEPLLAAVNLKCPRISGNELQRRFSDRDDIMCDICEGREYRKHVQSGFLPKANDIVSFTFNTDGVEVYKSSKYSLWPIWLRINELPPIQR